MIKIYDLLSYKLHRTANMLSRSAAMRYREEFDISMAEWRTIAILGAGAPISLTKLAREANLDKGQISRVVSGLVERGLVSREPASDHGRIIYLGLTRQGMTYYRKVMQVAFERDQAFVAGLSQEELQALETAMEKLTIVARAMISGHPSTAVQRRRLAAKE